MVFLIATQFTTQCVREKEIFTKNFNVVESMVYDI